MNEHADFRLAFAEFLDRLADNDADWILVFIADLSKLVLKPNDYDRVDLRQPKRVYLLL